MHASRQGSVSGKLFVSYYPHPEGQDAVLKNGLKVRLRHITVRDKSMAVKMFTDLTDETHRMRFFTKVRKQTYWSLITSGKVHADRRLTIIAETHTNDTEKRMLGLVQIFYDPAANIGEYAVIVADPWQNLGLGTILTDYILGVARQRKIDKLYAVYDRDNLLMQRILSKFNFTVRPYDGHLKAELILS